MEVKDVAAIIGAVTGPAGLTLAILVFFRDRANVKVSLNWDMEEVGAYADRNKKFFCVNISNIGRRPIYLSHVHFKNPTKSGAAFLLSDGLEGVTLAEGSRPHMVRADQTQKTVTDCASHWWRLRATVIDAAGKHYYSDWPIKAPSFAKNIKAPFGAIKWNKMRNWLRKKLP